jgi:hypothetical protein
MMAAAAPGEGQNEGERPLARSHPDGPVSLLEQTGRLRGENQRRATGPLKRRSFVDRVSRLESRREPSAQG